MGEIYFDNSSTTKPLQSVIDIVVQTMTVDYGNPSSLHQKGMEAEAYIRKARHAIAETMKVTDGEIYFTSGGTESNNWAVIGAALTGRRRGKRIITTEMEHPAIAEPLEFLRKEGFDIQKIPVNEKGELDLEVFSELLTEDTILVSTMFVNNEIGAVVPVEEVSKMIRAKAPNCLYHVDAIQAYGKYRIFPKKMGIDLLSVSGHKLHGPKGTGFLYISDRVRLVPILYGGGQQKGMRSGTDNVPGIAGLGVAAAEAYRDFDAKLEHIRGLRDYLIERLSELDDVVIHGMGENGAPHIVNAAFVGVGSEVLLHSLEDRGIYVSAGSACSTHKRAGSPTLNAIHAPKAEMTSSVRFSFCETNTKEEVDVLISALKELLPMLRRYRAH